MYKAVKAWKPRRSATTSQGHEKFLSTSLGKVKTIVIKEEVTSHLVLGEILHCSSRLYFLII